jgi:hypothetical protein
MYCICLIANITIALNLIILNIYGVVISVIIEVIELFMKVFIIWDTTIIPIIARNHFKNVIKNTNKNII